MATRRELTQQIAELREQLESLESRQRAARTALDALQRRVVELRLSAEQATAILSHITSIRLVLSGEVVL
jgi:hypothetical protein